MPSVEAMFFFIAGRCGASLGFSATSTESALASSNPFPLHMLTIGEATAANLVFIISRQHPPEVAGTMALQAFVERLCAKELLARQYRKAFTTVVVPLMNPDGVMQGHWRHNNNGVDLNRDWRLFAQPETRQVRDALLKIAAVPDARPFLFLDF